MKSINIEKSTPKTLLYLLAGAAAGVVNGALGAGGGIVLVFALAAISKDKSQNAVKERFITTLCVTSAVSAVSLFLYRAGIHPDMSLLPRLAVPGALGGLLGWWLMRRIDGENLKLLFGILTAVSGINMIMR